MKPRRHALLQAMCAAAPAALCVLAVPGAIGQEVAHDVASWPEGGHGNHRAVLRVSEPAEAVRAHIEWRRRDRRPETKDIRVFDLQTGARVTNVVRVNVTRAAGELVFQPATVPGEYAVYYLPYDPPGTGPFGDAGNYHPPQETADAAWVRRHGLTPETLAAGGWRSLPQAEVVAIQARGGFHRMDPMEVIATEEETAALLARYPDRDYLLFAEDRNHPIRLFEDLPLCWVQRGPSAGFHGAAQPGECYVFQIGVWACRAPIDDLAVEFIALRSPAGGVIPATALNCFNLGGTDARGRPLRRTVPVAQGVIRPLWVGLQVARDAQGTYQGTVRVQPRGQPETALNLTLDVSGPILEDCGDGDLWRLSRLRWLDSTLGLDDEVIPPFTPLEVRGDTTRCLGREVTFDHTGLPLRDAEHRAPRSGASTRAEAILAAAHGMSRSPRAGILPFPNEPSPGGDADEGSAPRASATTSARPCPRRRSWARRAGPNAPRPPRTVRWCASTSTAGRPVRRKLEVSCTWQSSERARGHCSCRHYAAACCRRRLLTPTCSSTGISSRPTPRMHRFPRAGG